MKLLAAGDYSDALTHFHAAIDANPDEYMNYFKRATVYMALSRSKQALADFDRVIQLKPDFLKAKHQRGELLLKMGRLNEAYEDLECIVKKEPNYNDVQERLILVGTLKNQIEVIKNAYKRNDYQLAIEGLNEIFEYIPWDPSLRELRAEAFLGLGNIVHAISDIRSVTKLKHDNSQGFLKLSNLHYQIGEPEESLVEIRECLKLDPDHTECHSIYKKLKKIVKFLKAAKEAHEKKDWERCIESSRKVLKEEQKVTGITFHAYDKLCICYLKSGNSLEARKACTDAIKINKVEPRLYCDRADAFLQEDLFDEAISDFRSALDIEKDLARAKKGLVRAQKLQKRAGKRDYYKLLGVKRNAKKKEIIKAYKKLAVKWHPDKFRDIDEKKTAEKKFMDIAAAKEVLSDPDMRAQYDRGADPLDPESGKDEQSFRHGGQNFKFRGGNPFGDGFQFKFHFN